MFVDQLLVDESRPPRQLSDVDHPDGDGVAVAPAVVLDLFDRVREGVAVVEDLAQRRLLEVDAHDVGLHLDRAPHQFGQHLAVDVERRVGVGVEEFEDARVGDEAALDDLGRPGDEITPRQGAQQVEVAHDGGRFVERADEVLALGGVDAGLPADGGVDHAEQRGRHLHDRHPAQPTRRDEPAEVGGRSPTERHDDVGAGEACLTEHRPQAHQHVGGFGRFGIGQFLDEHLTAACPQGFGETGGRVEHHRSVHEQHAGRAVGHHLGHPLEHPASEQQTVGRGDRGEVAHRWSAPVSPVSPARTSSTISSGVRSPVSTRTVPSRS